MRNRRLIDDRISLKYGAGGGAMRALIEQVFAAGLPAVDGIGLAAMDDGAAIRLPARPERSRAEGPAESNGWLVITTDSHVVSPWRFPGGDIGRLAVCGTVNDLAMMGATEPLALTCAAVIEDGFARADLETIWASIRHTCREAGTTIVTGDTKVMGHGELDGIVINTTGVAVADRIVGDAGLRAGDRILVTGSIGDHGLAIMATRRELSLDTELRSDVAPLNGLIRAALAAGGDGVVALKDPTRGGLASVLHEMADKAGVTLVIDEPAIPIGPEVRAVGDLLGIDPLLVANEGKAVLGVRADVADAVLAALRDHPLGRQAALIGSCIADRAGQVVLDTGFGRRLLVEPEGELLPRIC